MTEKRRNFFCHVCKQFAEFVLTQINDDTYPKWYCCSCDATKGEDMIDEYYPVKENE